MRKVKKITIFILIISLLLISLNCLGVQAAEKKYNVAVIVSTLVGNYFQIRLAEGCKKVGEELGVEVSIYAPTNFADYAEQINIVENLIIKKVDLILLNPNHPQALVPVIEAAVASGIPVVCVDNRPETDKILFFTGTSNEIESYKAGHYIADKIGGKGKVAILMGEVGYPNAILRTEGFKRAMKEYPGIEIVAEQNAHWTEQGGLEVTESILQTHSDIAALWCECDNIAFGAAKACEVKGVRPLIVGFDGIPEAFEAIKAGRIDATVAQFPDRMGAVGMRAGVAYLEYIKEIESLLSESPFKPVIDTQAVIIDKSNVGDYIK
jgi:ribose transport system substrate-binding protein